MASTSVPPALVEAFLTETNSLWLLGERDDAVAGEIVLCHPPLEIDEVRAVVKAMDGPRAWRMTVATSDRPGLLAATAGVLATKGLTITRAAVTVLAWHNLALQRVTFLSLTDDAEMAWERLGDRLREVLRSNRPVPVDWKPSGPVVVESHPQGSGRVLVQVEAVDAIGLLWAASRAINAQGVNIEAARLAEEDGTAKDVFIVTGAIDAAALTEALSDGVKVNAGTTLAAVLTLPLTVGARGLHYVARRLSRPG